MLEDMIGKKMDRNRYTDSFCWPRYGMLLLFMACQLFSYSQIQTSDFENKTYHGYYIKNYNHGGYLQPKDDDYLNLSAAGSKGAKNVWLFIGSGVQDTYYMYNVSTKEYICCADDYPEDDGANKIKMVESIPSDNEKIMFKVVSARNGAFALVPYKNNSTYSFNPYGGADGNIGFWEYSNDNSSLWVIEESPTPLSEGYYTIKSNYSSATTSSYMVHNGEVNAMWNLEGSKTSDFSSVWKLIPTSVPDQYFMRNVKTNKYLGIYSGQDYVMQDYLEDAVSVRVCEEETNHFSMYYNYYLHARAMEEKFSSSGWSDESYFKIMTVNTWAINSCNDWRLEEYTNSMYVYDIVFETPGFNPKSAYVDYNGNGYTGNTHLLDGGILAFSTDITPDASDFTAPICFGSSATISVDKDKRVVSVVYSSIVAEDLNSCINNGTAIKQSGSYKLTADIDAGALSVLPQTFSGILDFAGYKITGKLTAPLFQKIDGAYIHDLMIEDVAISGTGNAGAIAAEATGASRIYNCGVLSGSVSGTDKVGSLVGLLDGSSRVINCFSYANVTGGTDVGGIVGYNNYASTANDLRTMVMNCMYYGSITGGTNKSPVYGGQKITNAGSAGVNNYNYYSYANNSGEFTSYNVALAAEDKYLTRHEFYRGILNSTRGLCAYYIFGDALQTSGIYRWVVDWQDAKHPYPVLKPQGTTVYNSTVNRFVTGASNAIGNLTVVVNDGNGNTKTMTLPITPKDEKHYDYSYGKVVLPFYNTIEGFSGNYTNNQVVTGWDIVSVSGGTQGTLETTGDNAYNFADRKCTVKDERRVFAQGGYYYVPDGVTSITIKAHWGKAVYLSDAYYDVVYSTRYTAYDFTKAGARPTTFNSQPVYTTLNAAMNALTSVSTVYDQAIVLVGNYHSLTGKNTVAWIGNNYPFTLMSVDLDNDHEPDYCMFHQHEDRISVAPIRFDFLWHPGVGMAHRVDGTGRMPNQGIFHANGWFEITETALARYTEFEYGYGDNTPMILNNGIFDQFVSRHDNTTTQKSYMILGGNLYMQCFSPGVHPDNSGATTHCPVTVLGGEFKEFYLSGTYRPDAAVSQSDNASCYIDGGKFGTVAGAGQEQIDGDVFFKINYADIDEFYGGGINASKPITGNIYVKIDNSSVNKYCGGPKFGAMGGSDTEETTDDKSIETIATNTRFGSFYGAGNGGTSLYRLQKDKNNSMSAKSDETWNRWADETQNELGSYKDNVGKFTTDRGVLVQPDYEFFTWAGGAEEQHVGRYYYVWAMFDKATTNDVTSKLSSCEIGNLYGGGMIGQVKGRISTTLTDCAVLGNAFGGGYSAAIPTVEVYKTEGKFVTGYYPEYNTNAGVYVQGSFGTPDIYTWSAWESAPLNSDSYLNDTNNTIYTSSLDGLGQVSGKIKLEITGGSVGGSVYGGGDESESQNNTEVVITNATITGNVFGGGNKAKVGQNTTVRILGSTTVEQNVYGGGNEAEVGGTTTVQIGEECVTTSTNSENGGE